MSSIKEVFCRVFLKMNLCGEILALSVNFHIFKNKIIWNEKAIFTTIILFYLYFFDGLDFVAHSFAYVAHFVCLRDVWIRTQRPILASRCATNLATHLPAASTVLFSVFIVLKFKKITSL